MLLDYTIKTYRLLLNEFLLCGYEFQTFQEFQMNPRNGKVVILRHDVDRTPKNAVRMAKIEAELNIKSSYYFRIVDESYNENCIQAIVGLNHELGYHYEDLALSKGNKGLAIQIFVKNLEKLRKFYPINTMCMHGSPRSNYDNRSLWESYNYREYGIIAEPYFDLDFNHILYITDASRSWNNEAVTLRDRVESNFKFDINSSHHIIGLLQSSSLPDRVMINVHPHNWSKNLSEWIKIKLWQEFKNQFKKMLIVRKKRLKN